jgi:aminoglycoside/choline kinase family phosphotransferase
MTSRRQKRDNFIKSIGWDDATSDVVAGDASNRSYDRLIKAEGQTAILMNAPPEKGEDVRPFVKILEYLRANNLEAPELLAVNSSDGFLLLEDLGDNLFAHICQTSPRLENTLYRAAIDVLLQLHKAPSPRDVAPYDLATYLRETDLVTDWYLPSITGKFTPQAIIGTYQSKVATVCAAIDTTDPVLVLRDYHAENLLWLPARAGVKNVGLLDFQDALMGHPAYDLVSLLEDARRDTSDALQISMKNYFIEKSGMDKTSFNYAYAALGAQRNLKIIGIFARLCVRDGKPQYIDLIPRVWAHLERDLTHPELSDLKDWVAHNLPKPTPEILMRIKEAKNVS